MITRPNHALEDDTDKPCTRASIAEDIYLGQGRHYSLSGWQYLIATTLDLRSAHAGMADLPMQRRRT